MTQKDWWDLLNNNWDDILKSFQICENYRGKKILSGAKIVPLIYDIPYMEECREEKNAHPLYLAINNLWSKAPDSPIIHKWPAWDAICDLCSEYSETFNRY